jgi:hypothetical protein
MSKWAIFLPSRYASQLTTAAWVLRSMVIFG